jgi:hypothetical protein
MFPVPEEANIGWYREKRLSSHEDGGFFTFHKAEGGRQKAEGGSYFFLS